MRCRVQSKQANLYRLAFLFSAAGKGVAKAVAKCRAPRANPIFY
jgi:hypothetical protein